MNEDLKEIEEAEERWRQRFAGHEERKRGDNFVTASHIPVNPLYTPGSIKDIDYLRDTGFPGEPPFVRGIYPTMYRGRYWTIRIFSGHGTPEETNERWKMLYKEGETGFSAAVDALTHCGFSPEDPRYDAEVGTEGVPLYTITSMDALVKELPIESVSFAFVVQSFASAVVSSFFFNVAKEKGIDIKNLKGTSTNDILTITLARPQPKMVPPKNLLKLTCDLIEWCTVQKNVPQWHPISITSYNIREGGIDAVQEIAFAFAAARACCDELMERGHKIDDFANRMAFHFSSDSDLFEEIAKFRAARRIWYRLMREKYGAKEEESCALRFHVQTAGVSLTAQQPLINTVRVAYQALAAVLGGCQSLHTDSYDEAMSLPSEEAVLVALRTQHILQEETRVANTIDPLGGSYYVEWLTKEIEERIWRYMGEIDAVGGFIKAIETGWAYNEMTKAFYKRQKAVEGGEEKIVGVNCYVTDERFGIKPFRTNPLAAEVEKERVRKLKKGRDNNKIEKLLGKLKESCYREENVMPALMELTNGGATLSEVCDVYREVWGTWEAPVQI